MSEVEGSSVDHLIRDHPSGVTLTLLVTPGASRTEIVGPHGIYLRVRVAAPPEGGLANRAAVRLLTNAFGCRVDLLSGASGRVKRMLLRGVARSEVVGALSDLGR